MGPRHCVHRKNPGQVAHYVSTGRVLQGGHNWNNMEFPRSRDFAIGHLVLCYASCSLIKNNMYFVASYRCPIARLVVLQTIFIESFQNLRALRSKNTCNWCFQHKILCSRDNASTIIYVFLLFCVLSSPSLASLLIPICCVFACIVVLTYMQLFL